MMVKSIITGQNPETNEVVTHELEAGAICTVSVKEETESVEAHCSVMGHMNGRMAEAMIEGLINACHEILKGVDPLLAALILSKALNKNSEEGKVDGMAGESSEPERPTEQ